MTVGMSIYCIIYIFSHIKNNSDNNNEYVYIYIYIHSYIYCATCECPSLTLQKKTISNQNAGRLGFMYVDALIVTCMYLGSRGPPNVIFWLLWKVMKLNTGNWKVRGVYSHLHLLEYVNAEPPNLQCPGYFPKWPEKSGCEMVVNCPHWNTSSCPMFATGAQGNDFICNWRVRVNLVSNY